MKLYKKIIAVALVLLTFSGLSSPVFANAQDLPEQVQSIADEGALRVGVKQDVPNFGYLNPDTNEHEGFEIELAKLIANEITGSPDNIEYTGVTPNTRGPLLDNDELHMVIATFTITDERRESYNFTEPYFVDEVGFLVRTADGYTDIASLDGAMLGVSQSSTTRQLVEAYGEENGLSFQFSELASYPELKTALTSRRIDALVVDKSILSGYVDNETEILGVGFAPQEYGIATKLSNSELDAWLNELLASWKEDGTLDELLQAHGLETAEATEDDEASEEETEEGTEEESEESTEEDSE